MNRILLAFVLLAASLGAEDAPRPDYSKAIARNERFAEARLRNFIAAQAHFQATAKADENRNGVGEYAGFAELSGAKPVRGTDEVLKPPVLVEKFQRIKEGRVLNLGYYYRIYLPGQKAPVGEEPRGGFKPGSVDAKLAQSVWCCYAWPKAHGRTGKRTFFVSQWGDILATEGRYSGNKEPDPLAAYVEKAKNLDGKVAYDAKGQDGNAWKRS